MISVILQILKYLFKSWRAISAWGLVLVIAAVGAYVVSFTSELFSNFDFTFGLNHKWDSLCNAVADYIGGVSTYISRIHLDSGIGWIDTVADICGITFAVQLFVAFAAFFLPLYGAAFIGMLCGLLSLFLAFIWRKFALAWGEKIAKNASSAVNSPFGGS